MGRLSFHVLCAVYALVQSYCPVVSAVVAAKLNIVVIAFLPLPLKVGSEAPPGTFFYVRKRDSTNAPVTIWQYAFSVSWRRWLI